jgi:rRNA small subunit aminocarboxypropyltransferase
MEKQARITVYHANQCDPKRCTGLKLRRHGKARIVSKTRFLPKRAVVLNPFSGIAFSPADRKRVEDFGLVALDCSWEHAEKVLMKNVKGTSRCLPILIAGNPVNFGKATKLTTAEALAAALYIAGFKKEASELLSIFVWGHTFLELNQSILESYSTAHDSAEIIKIQDDLCQDSCRR